jgi:uncharacterized membrane protein HdeD (DUF308 family)
LIIQQNAGKTQYPRLLNGCCIIYNQISIKVKKGASIMDGLLSVSGLVAGIISIVAGVVVLIWPKVLAYIIGIYLIIIGAVAVITVLR